MKLKDRLTKLVDKFGIERVRQLLDVIEFESPQVGKNIRDDIDAVIDNLVPEDIGSQPFLMKVEKPKRDKKYVAQDINDSHRYLMYRICFCIETERQAMTLDGQQRGRVSSALGKLLDAQADLSKLSLFEGWWKAHWRSKDRDGNYNPPTPNQVVENWWVAMQQVEYRKREQEYKAQHNSSQRPFVVVDFEERMRQRALDRKNG